MPRLGGWLDSALPSAQELDAEYVAKFARRIAELFPACPAEEQEAIAEHACQKHSGRIGRSSAAKSFDAGAIELAVRAHVRHLHTRYDEVLGRGIFREEARAIVADEVAKRLNQWSGANPPEGDDAEKPSTIRSS